MQLTTHSLGQVLANALIDIGQKITYAIHGSMHSKIGCYTVAQAKGEGGAGPLPTGGGKNHHALYVFEKLKKWKEIPKKSHFST